MSLRARLLTGYGIFIAALVTLGAWSAWRLHDMGVKVDRSQVERVLANLVVNAIRYTKQGVIKISAQPRGNSVAVLFPTRAAAFRPSICRTSSTSSCKYPARPPEAPAWAWRSHD